MIVNECDKRMIRGILGNSSRRQRIRHLAVIQMRRGQELIMEPGVAGRSGIIQQNVKA